MVPGSDRPVTGQRPMRAARPYSGAATRGMAVVAGGSATLSMDEVFAVDLEGCIGHDNAHPR